MTFNDLELQSFLPDSNQDHAHHLNRYFLKNHVHQALLCGLKDPEYATIALAKYFRQNRSLGSKDRRRAADFCYEIIRKEGLLRRCGAQNIEECIEVYHRLLKGEELVPESISPVSDFAAALSLPQDIAQEWFCRFSIPQALLLAQSLTVQPPIYIRSKYRGKKRRALQQDLLKENIHTELVPKSDSALILTHRANLIATSPYKNGLFEIQNLSSQRFCQELEQHLGTLAGLKILDLCAGAGGKSLALASRGALVFATDPRSHALNELSKRASRARTKVSIGVPSKSDLVLLDVPCSGMGRLAREPALRWKYQHQSHLKHCTIQQKLLQQAAQLTDKYIVYATCSLLEAENTPSLDGWVKEHSVWYWPHQHNGDGFFWSILKKDN